MSYNPVSKTFEALNFEEVQATILFPIMNRLRCFYFPSARVSVPTMNSCRNRRLQGRTIFHKLVRNHPRHLPTFTIYPGEQRNAIERTSCSLRRIVDSTFSNLGCWVPVVLPAIPVEGVSARTHVI